MIISTALAFRELLIQRYRELEVRLIAIHCDSRRLKLRKNSFSNLVQWRAERL